MDHIPLTPQAFNGRGIPLCQQPPPPPPPRRTSKQEYSKSNNDQNATIDAVVDVDSGYEYMSNPIKVDMGSHRQTFNVCKERETVSVRTHHDKRSKYGGNGRDGTMGVIKSGKLRNICSAYEETGDAKGGRSSSQSNSRFKSMDLNNDTTDLTDQSVYEQYPWDTLEKTGNANSDIFNCGCKSSGNKVKDENVGKIEAMMLIRSCCETPGHTRMRRMGISH